MAVQHQTHIWILRKNTVLFRYTINKTGAGEKKKHQSFKGLTREMKERNSIPPIATN